jgi:hypothetical protein
MGFKEELMGLFDEDSNSYITPKSDSDPFSNKRYFTSLMPIKEPSNSRQSGRFQEIFESKLEALVESAGDFNHRPDISPLKKESDQNGYLRNIYDVRFDQGNIIEPIERQIDNYSNLNLNLLPTHIILKNDYNQIQLEKNIIQKIPFLDESNENPILPPNLEEFLRQLKEQQIRKVDREQQEADDPSKIQETWQRPIVTDALQQILENHYQSEVKIVKRDTVHAGRNDNKVITYVVGNQTKKAFVKEVEFTSQVEKDRFLREMYLQGALHQIGVSVSKPLAALDLGSRGIIVQEYFEGKSLDAITKGLPYEKKVRVLTQVTRELAKYQAKATLNSQAIYQAMRGTDMDNHDADFFESVVAKAHKRLGEVGDGPQELIATLADAQKGKIKYAGHGDFNPWNVMVVKGKDGKAQIRIIDLETATVPTPDLEQGAALGYDLATMLSWPGYDVGPILQRDLLETYVGEFNKTLEQTDAMSNSQYQRLAINNPHEFAKDVEKLQAATSYWLAGIEVAETNKGNAHRLNTARKAIAAFNASSYAPSDARYAA